MIPDFVHYHLLEGHREWLQKQARPIVAAKLAEQSPETNPYRKTAWARRQAKIQCHKMSNGELSSIIDNNEREETAESFKRFDLYTQRGNKRIAEDAHSFALIGRQ